MAFYTYVGNLDPNEKTARIFLRGGTLRIDLNEWADLTDDEFGYLSTRYRLVAGQFGAQAGSSYPRVVELEDSIDPTPVGQRLITDTEGISSFDLDAINVRVPFIGPDGTTVYQAKGDWQTQTGATISAGSKTLSVSGHTFTIDEVGKVVVLWNAATLDEIAQPRPSVYWSGAGNVQPGNLFWTTIADVSAGKAILTAAPTRSINNQRIEWGTDDTAALNAAFAKAALDADTTGNIRTVLIPQGHYRASQINADTRTRIVGEGWGDSQLLISSAIYMPGDGTVLRQLEGSECDFLIFEANLDVSGNKFVGPNDLDNLFLQGPWTGTIGSGVKVTTPAGDAIGQDGLRMHYVTVQGFPEHGFELPRAGIMVNPKHCRARFNGGYGYYLDANGSSGNAQSIHLEDFSGDGNGLGLAYFGRLSSLNSEAVVVLTNLKSEGRHWASVGLRRNPPQRFTQKNCIVIDRCPNTFVINGVQHISAAQDYDTDASGNTYFAPGPVIEIKGTASEDRPNIEWRGIGSRDLASSSGRVETGAVDAVLLRDAAYGLNIPRSVTTGTYQGDSTSSAPQSWAKKGLSKGTWGRRGRRFLAGLRNDGTTPTAFREATYAQITPDDQVAGELPGRSWYETDGPNESKHYVLALSGGIFSARAIDDDGSAGDIAWQITRSASKVLTTIFGSGTAGSKLGFFGAGGITKPNIVGARGGDAALANLLASLANYGLITDSTTGDVLRQTASGNHAMSIYHRLVAITSTAAARTVTLPSAANLTAGKMYVVKDESGGAATNAIALACQGSDTWEDGSTSKSITTNYGAIRFYSDGAAKFYLA